MCIKLFQMIVLVSRLLPQDKVSAMRTFCHHLRRFSRSPPVGPGTRAVVHGVLHGEDTRQSCVLHGFSWEHPAPAWLLELGWRRALPGGHWRSNCGAKHHGCNVRLRSLPLRSMNAGIRELLHGVIIRRQCLSTARPLLYALTEGSDVAVELGEVLGQRPKATRGARQGLLQHYGR